MISRKGRCQLFTLLNLMALAGCGPKHELVKKKVSIPTEITQAGHKPTDHMITVLIHGSRFFKPLDQYFHRIAPRGMHAIKTLEPRHRMHAVLRALTTADPQRFSDQTCYAFGWHGNLSFSERKETARELYGSLDQLIQDYQKSNNCTPGIRLITHSHGGNVALNLANVKNPDNPLYIDELIMLAVPVQPQTRLLAQDPFFKKVYSIYSSFDTLQVLDPQGMYRSQANEKRRLAFSHRRFPDSDNIRQAKIRINGHGIAHIGFVTPSFLSLLPSIIDEMERWERELPGSPGEERVLSIRRKKSS